MRPLDEGTINELFRIGVLSSNEVRRINIIKGLEAGVSPSMLAIRYGCCRQVVYKYKRKIRPSS